MFRRDNRIKAAAIFCGVSDTVANFIARTDMQPIYINYLGGTPDQVLQEYKNRSAVLWANEINVPLLIVHGDQDWRVDVKQARDMAENLEKFGKENSLIIGAQHDLQGTQYLEEMDKWFIEHPL